MEETYQIIEGPPVSGGPCFPMGFANGGRLFGSQGRRL